MLFSKTVLGNVQEFQIQKMCFHLAIALHGLYKHQQLEPCCVHKISVNKLDRQLLLLIYYTITKCRKYFLRFDADTIFRFLSHAIDKYLINRHLKVGMTLSL